LHTAVRSSFIAAKTASDAVILLCAQQRAPSVVTLALEISPYLFWHQAALMR
jgi:hypothetical protein